MARKILNIFFCLTLGIVLVGCASVKVKSYVDVKDRVDQEMTGNAGYLQGNPPPQPVSPSKKTRRVYVLEFTEKTPEVEEASVPGRPMKTSNSSAAVSGPSVTTNAALNMEPQMPFVPVALPTEYTVGKDDTLQTISKKFYNSYAKWPKIYEANKDKIPDPNRIKPGLVLTIPAIYSTSQ